MGNVMMEASQINYRGGVTKMSVEQALKETSGEAAAIAALQAAVGNLQTGKADLPVIAPEFDAETGVYAVGDLVMYQGKLYEFTTAHETAGDWNSTEVTEKTVSDEIDSLKSGLIDVNSNIVNLVSIETHTTNEDTASANGGRLGLTCNAARQGYTAIGIVGVVLMKDQSNIENGACIGSAYIDNDGNVQISARNYTSSSITAFAKVVILYIKNT